jgi:SAM-dependent methyltransferase
MESWKKGLDALGLLGAARSARDLLKSARFVRPNLRYWRDGAPDGLPIPPLSLRMLVAGSPDIGWFLDGGRRGAESIRATLLRTGADVVQCRAILDFGCGCGRVTRHWRSLTGEVHGTDVNPRLVDWCRRRLAFARFSQNALAPPLDAEDGRFDLVYALSVFTHLTADLQHAWVAEFFRVLRPGGFLLFTTHGRRYVDRLAPEEARRFTGGELVARDAGPEGSNLYGTYHPEAWVRARLAGPFEVRDFVPEGALGNPWQDVWLFRRP